MRGIKGVTFDFGGTLALGDLDKQGLRENLLGYLRSLGFSGQEAQVRKARNGMLERLMRAQAQNREIRIEDLYQGMLFRIGLHPESDVIDYIHQLYIRSFQVELVPSAKEVLESLSAKYRLAVVSNAISDVARHALKKFDLEEYFHSVIISRDIGIRKPDPEIFRFALTNLGLESNEAVHVGDSLKEDVQGAKSLGMKAIWIADSGEETAVQPDYTIYSLSELTLLL